MFHVKEDAEKALSEALCKFVRENVRLAMNQIIRNVRVFIEYRAEDEVVACSNEKVTKVVKLLSIAKDYLAIDS